MGGSGEMSLLAVTGGYWFSEKEAQLSVLPFQRTRVLRASFSKNRLVWQKEAHRSQEKHSQPTTFIWHQDSDDGPKSRNEVGYVLSKYYLYYYH